MTFPAFSKHLENPSSHFVLKEFATDTDALQVSCISFSIKCLKDFSFHCFLNIVTFFKNPLYKVKSHFHSSLNNLVTPSLLTIDFRLLSLSNVSWLVTDL
jgi:hypothetical protein